MPATQKKKDTVQVYVIEPHYDPDFDQCVVACEDWKGANAVIHEVADEILRMRTPDEIQAQDGPVQISIDVETWERSRYEALPNIS